MSIIDIHIKNEFFLLIKPFGLLSVKVGALVTMSHTRHVTDIDENASSLASCGILQVVTSVKVEFTSPNSHLW